MIRWVGSSGGLSWLIFLFHVALTDITGWYSFVDGLDALEDPGYLTHIYGTWKNVVDCVHMIFLA